MTFEELLACEVRPADVPVADPVMVQQALAARRGIAAELESPPLPA